MNTSKRLTLSALFIAIGFALPFLTGQIPQIGSMLLPMHIPVFLCALICGWEYGLGVGLLLPLARSLFFQMPPLFPTAIAMSFELATYGVVAGLLYGLSKWKCVMAVFKAMLPAMLAGRAVWGLVMWVLMTGGAKAFTGAMFLSGAVLNALPGIALQLVLVPVVMVALGHAKLVPFHAGRKARTVIEQ